MKLLFLCGSAELGKDGVGDYTRRLCGELIRRGHQAQIISLCDKHSDTFISQIQVIENTHVLVNRIPIKFTYSKKLSHTQVIVQEFTPDWISLQYVPHSFNLKGLPFWLTSFLRKVNVNNKLHVMFHELWQGMEDGSSFKNKCFRFLQKQLVKKILNDFNTIVVSTNTKLYQYEITKLGYDSNILGLFSNIVNVKSLEVKHLGIPTRDIKIAMFSTIHHNSPIQQFLDELKLELKKRDFQMLKFVFIGNCGKNLKEWTLILDEKKIEYEIFGYCTEHDISEKLLMCDFGLSTSPYLTIQKSGSVAAYIEHNLPVICVARKWDVSGFNVDITNQIENVFDFNKDEISKIFDIKIKKHKINTLSSVTDNFLNSLDLF